MSTNEVRSNDARLATLDMKLEVIVIPVSDVDRAKGSTGNSGGGSTPTSPSITASGSFSSRRPDRGARSNSARTSRRPRPARRTAST